MSVLTEKTDKQAIKELAKCLIHFERLYPFNMSAQDAAEARQAQNLIRAIIETNGYRVIHKSGKGTRIYRQAKCTNTN
jgi:hypothetical protein